MLTTVEHTTGFTLPYPAEEVFPLFTPEGEKLWAPGWDYHNLMGTNVLSEDYVFLTANHDHAAADAIWLVKHYSPEEGLVAYFRVEPGDKVGVVTVRCSSINGEGTQVEVTYRYIPLSHKGQIFVDGYTQEAHREFIAQWEKLLLKYFDSRHASNSGGTHER